MHLKIVQKLNISREFCTFPVTEGNEIWHSFQNTIPTRKLTQDTKFGHSKIICHFGPENPQIWTQNDTNFGHSKIICHFGPENPQIQTQNDTNFGHSNIIRHLGPENPQKPTQKDTTFEKMHSLTLTKNNHKIRKIFIFPEFCTICTFIKMHSLTPTNTNQLTTMGKPSNMIQILQTNCDTFGQ